MRDRLRVFMQNMSGFKTGAACFLAAVLFLPPVFAAEENPLHAAVQKFEEKVTPVMTAAETAGQEEPAGKSKEKKDKFLGKIQKTRQGFYNEERERRRHFLEKMRKQDMSSEENQQKLQKFHAKELERRQKFADKMNKKILKHTPAET